MQVANPSHGQVKTDRRMVSELDSSDSTPLVGNDGMRFVLDDMTELAGKTYASGEKGHFETQGLLR